MFEMLGDIAGAVLSGGATGLLGTVISFGTDFFKRRQQHAQEVELRRLDAEVAKIESAGFERVAEIEAEGERQRGELAAFEQSYREAARRWSTPQDGPMMKFVDFCRGMTRPVLTVGFVSLTGAIYFTLGTDDPEIRKRIIDTVLYLNVSTVLWWFGARQVSKPPAVR